MPILKVLPTQESIAVEKGADLLEALRNAGVEVPTDCGGNGSCNKCIVRIRRGSLPASPQDQRHLERWEIEEGFRFSCGVPVQDNLTLELPEHGRLYGQRIVADGVRCVAHENRKPATKQYFVTLEKATLQDPLDDLGRLTRHLKTVCPDEPLNLTATPYALSQLSQALRSDNFKATVTLCENQLLEAQAGDTRGTALGMAFDIGTTTVVGYLLNLQNGKELAVASQRNPQASVGYNVLARAEFASKGPDKLLQLQQSIVGCLQELTEECTRTAGVSVNDCYEVSVCGNTIMTHLLLGVSPEHIGIVPFTPSWTRALSLPAKDVGLRMHPQCQLYTLPSVAGYVGGDITAGLLATGLPGEQDLTLFVDIGTNGEVVLGDHRGWTACASPAGPAFEGARITCGMPAGKGAIDRVTFNAQTQDLVFETIDDEPARGVCGTGLIDAVASFLESGILEPTGRLLDPEEATKQLPPSLARRVLPPTKKDHGPSVLLLPAEQTAGGRKPLTLTQRDIRELQLASDSGRNRHGPPCSRLLGRRGKKGIHCRWIRKLYPAGISRNHWLAAGGHLQRQDLLYGEQRRRRREDVPA